MAGPLESSSRVSCVWRRRKTTRLKCKHIRLRISLAEAAAAATRKESPSSIGVRLQCGGINVNLSNVHTPRTWREILQCAATKTAAMVSSASSRMSSGRWVKLEHEMLQIFRRKLKTKKYNLKQQ